MSIMVFMPCLLLATACFTGGIVYLSPSGSYGHRYFAEVGRHNDLCSYPCVLFVGTANIMAKYLLYREENADLQVIGGIRYGSFIEAMRSGKQGTWPFAKLLITTDRLWIHSPWGTEAWNRGQLPLMRLERSFLNPKLVIHMPEITFFLLPWHCRKVEEAIRMLGYGKH